MEDFQEAKSGRDSNPGSNKRGQKQRGGSKEGNRGGQHYQKKQ